MPKKSLYIAEADEADLTNFVKEGFFQHYSEAHRAALSRGIREIKKERGISN